MTESDGSQNRSSPTFCEISVDIENVGGIDTASLQFSRGVTALTGRNATNRTSLLRAIAGGLGGTEGVLKQDADSGSVSLTIDGAQFTRQYTRVGNTVRTSGQPYVDDETLVDLFVCLLEQNPIRQAVRTGDDLAELLLSPIDTDEIETKIEQLRSERRQIEERLTEIDRERKRLPHLEERRNDLHDQIEDLKLELETVRERTSNTERETAATDETESILRSLEEAQGQLERTEAELETQRDIRDELETELADVREELSEIEVDDQRLSKLEQRTERLQGRESELSVAINELSTILTQNQNVLEGNDAVVTELTVDDDAVSELDPATQSIECWTCGSRVERQAISDRLDDIRQLVDVKREQRDEVRDQLSECRSKCDAIQRSRQQRQDLVERESGLERELDRRADTIDQLTDEGATLRSEIADLQAELDSQEDTTENDDIAAIERLSELEYERGQLEQEIQEVNDEINEIEYLLGKSKDFETRRADITEQVTSLQSRVEDIEKETVETFNTHMTSVLDRLQYENIERVWIERRRSGGETTFVLHVVRTDDSGNVYEGLAAHLSESEREVVGLVVALAGYLVHDIRESVPVLLLDSLEAIDADRIAALVDYVGVQTDFLLVALLQEDASTLSESHERVVATEHLT